MFLFQCRVPPYLANLAPKALKEEFIFNVENHYLLGITPFYTSLATSFSANANLYSP
jgi:hypothetical protein